jgi:hypothetical protein
MLLLLFISLLLLADYCNHAFKLVPLFVVAPPYIFNQRKNNDRGIQITKLFALGDSGDYLSKLSANNAQRDDESQSSIPIVDKGVGAISKNNIAQSAFLHNVASTVTNEVERRTTEIDTQLSLLQSDIKSLAERSIDQLVGVPNVLTKVTRRGTRDFRRTTLLAQQVVKKNTNVIVDNFTTTTGKGLVDIHFFDDVVSTNTIKATEIVKWIESQTRSGTTIVSSKAKTIILKFTNKEEYKFGDVTKELVHRVVTQEINMRDVILLLKVSLLSLWLIFI